MQEETPKGDPASQNKPDIPKRKYRLKWQKAFLSQLAQCANITQACKAACIDPATVYEARSKDPEFRAAWEQALDDGMNAIEAKAMQVATNGDGAMIRFLLMTRRREKYGEQPEQRQTGQSPTIHIEKDSNDSDEVSPSV